MEKSISQYLKFGSQTEITPEIQKIANSFKQKDIDLVLEILQWIHFHFQCEPFDKSIFRKRTADEIVKSRLVTGCSDFALVFIVLARSKNIPTKYIETIKRQWLEKGDKQHLQGHIFAKCFINDKWYIINPEQGTIVFAYRHYVFWKQGLDSWDIGIHNFNELRDQFLEFQKSYKK